jgi:hypothetical protein
MNKAIGVSEINKQLEAEIGKNIHELKRGRAALPAGECEQSANDLGILFRKMSERSMREIEGLMDELQSLRKKLENDGDLIERAIAQHSQFSQGAMQLTTIIADNVKRLPHSTS